MYQTNINSCWKEKALKWEVIPNNCILFKWQMLHNCSRIGNCHNIRLRINLFFVQLQFTNNKQIPGVLNYSLFHWFHVRLFKSKSRQHIAFSLKYKDTVDRPIRESSSKMKLYRKSLNLSNALREIIPSQLIVSLIQFVCASSTVYDACCSSCSCSSVIHSIYMNERLNHPIHYDAWWWRFDWLQNLFEEEITMKAKERVGYG
jgi:hypothetical protein